MGQQKQRIISGEPEKKKTKSEKYPAEKEKIQTPKKEIKEPKKKKERSKKYLQIKKQILSKPLISVKEAIEVLKKVSDSPFDSAFELHIALNMEPKKEAKLKIKPDKNLVFHVKIGKVSDKKDQIQKNFDTILKEVSHARPSGKKNFIKSIALCTTQSPAIKIKIEDQK